MYQKKLMCFLGYQYRVYVTSQRVCGAVVCPPIVEATRPGSIPSLGSLRCGTGDFPQRGTGVRVCVRGYRCVVCVHV